VVTTQRVRSGGASLAVQERGGGGETIVLVHGYPDTARLWDPVAEQLAGDHHVVTYDVRAAGASRAPDDRSCYRMPLLLDDLLAVIDATAPSGRVHLVGHDWGAIQGFAALHDERLTRRLASFTAVSAPGLEEARWWLRTRVADRSAGAVADLADQWSRSWYLGVFQLPVLPELLLRRAVRTSLRRGGHPDPGPTVEDDAVRGLALYRANGSPRSLRAPVGTLPEDVLVRVLVGRGDRYVSPRVFDDLRDRLGVEVHEVDGGHWLPLTHPDLVAEVVRTTVGDATTG
jgi:pimeloyl-ACP methyl ester carboxylesterase